MRTDGIEYSDDKMGIEIPKEKRYLNTTSYDYSVDYLVELMSGDSPKIILEVPFQRNFIWTEDRSSQLIESVIMNVPIPPLYFAEEENGKWLVIDGLQRLNTLKGFFQNRFSLKNLEIVTELVGMKYSDLPPKSRNLLKDGLLRVNVIKNDSHEDIKYDIFMRLNKGSVSLNYQELRNCLYRGNFNDSVKKFVKDNRKFLQILNLKQAHKRYLDVEFIMRILALEEKLSVNEEGNFYVKDYSGRMVNFINDFMKRKVKLSETESKEILDKFSDTIDKVIEIFGVGGAFKNIAISPYKFNKSIGEFIAISFSRYELSVLLRKKEEIIDLLINLLSEDETFRKSISQKTTDTDIVNFRLNFWLKELSNVLQF